MRIEAWQAERRKGGTMKKLFAFFGTLFMAMMASGLALAAEGAAEPVIRR